MINPQFQTPVHPFKLFVHLSQKMKKLYLIDFDGTVTSKDSFILFSYFSLNIILFIRYWFCVLLQLFYFKKETLKERFYNHFRFLPVPQFQALCDEFEEIVIRKIVKKSFLNYVNKIDPESKIVIVSASIKNYLEPWCNKMGFELISTELEVVNGTLTGRFSTYNCNGEEKVRRIKEKYNLSLYHQIHVFGNSKGDLPMLGLGTHQYYKFFT